MVEDDVCNVVRDLQELDPSFRVRFSEAGNYFVVYQVIDGEKEHLVTTTTELDQRLVKRMREITDPSYDYSAELEKLEDKADAEKQKQMDETMEQAGERISHAIRKDMGFWRDSARSKKSWGKK